MRSITSMSAVAAVLALFVLSSVLSGPALAQSLEPVSVGIAGHSINFLPAIVAKAEGFTEKHGLDVTHLYISGDTPLIQGLVAGEFPIGINTSTAMVNSHLQGFDPVLIASFIPHMPFHIIGRPGITPENLKGGSIAISGPGSGTDAVVRMALSRFGLAVERDVAIVAMGGQTSRLAALQVGRVDATVLSPPLSYQLIDEGYTMLLNLMAERIPSNHESVVTTKRVVNENSELLKKYLRAIGEAVHYILTDREGAIRHIAEYLEMDLETERSIIERTYDEYAAYNIPRVPYPLVTGMRNVLEIAVLQNPEVVRIDPWDLIDVRLIRELEEEGFFAALYE